MSSEKFEDLEDEFKTLCEDLRTTINSKIPKLSGGKQRGWDNHVTSFFVGLEMVDDRTVCAGVFCVLTMKCLTVVQSGERGPSERRRGR